MQRVWQNLLFPAPLGCPALFPSWDRFLLALLLLPAAGTGSNRKNRYGQSAAELCTAGSGSWQRGKVRPQDCSRVWKHCLVLPIFVEVLAHCSRENKRGKKTKCHGQQKPAFHITVAPSRHLDRGFYKWILNFPRGYLRNMKAHVKRKNIALHELVWPCLAGILLGWCRSNGEQDSAEMTLHRCSWFYWSSFRLIDMQNIQLTWENRKGRQLPYDFFVFFYTAEWLSPHSKEKRGRKPERSTKKVVHGD